MNGLRERQIPDRMRPQFTSRETSSTTSASGTPLIWFPIDLWTAFGPARVLATETKGAPGERKLSAHVWIVASGRIKKAHTSQLRHASETEKLIAEASDPVVYPWTMTSLAAMNKGAYEDLTVPPLLTAGYCPMVEYLIKIIFLLRLMI